MQTFLPYSDFEQTARVLDRQRLGKQRVECKQLLQALGVPVGGPLADKPSSWRNHPAARMWKGHEMRLAVYAVRICDEWINRGYRDTLRQQFLSAVSWMLHQKYEPVGPAWLGDCDFHASHRSNLLRKLPQHYSQFGWAESDCLPYVWPTGTAVAPVNV